MATAAAAGETEMRAHVQLGVRDLWRMRIVLRAREAVRTAARWVRDGWDPDCPDCPADGACLCGAAW